MHIKFPSGYELDSSHLIYLELKVFTLFLAKYHIRHEAPKLKNQECDNVLPGKGFHTPFNLPDMKVKFMEIFRINIPSIRMRRAL
jgi:hypothetical protein